MLSTCIAPARSLPHSCLRISMSVAVMGGPFELTMRGCRLETLVRSRSSGTLNAQISGLDG
eukprot:1681131-Alexandrium_andersonii.AAC.1